MTVNEKRTNAKLQLALDTLERYCEDANAAIAILRRMHEMKPRADLAMRVVKEILDGEKAAEEALFRSRLLDDAAAPPASE